MVAQSPTDPGALGEDRHPGALQHRAIGAQFRRVQCTSDLMPSDVVGVNIYSATERFSRVLGALLDAGVSLSDALPSATDCTNNLVFQARLATATEGVLAGRGFTEPMREVDLFPSTMLQMVRVGERTGELSDQLTNSATFFEEELSYAVDKLTQYFEPMVLLFIGVVVGFVALAMVSAMYGLYGQLQA